jgi:SAM-dependent methyltransferase
VSTDLELAQRIRRYYTAYYRDRLGIPDWARLVSLREEEERQERRRVERVRQVLGAVAVGRVLNVGCGTGGFNVAAVEAGARAVGVDTDAEAIAICAMKRRQAGGSFLRASAEALPFADGAFDLVYCFSAIEHVESVEDAIREMVRVTRRGGAIYLHTPNAWSWYEGHYKIFWTPLLPRPLARLYLRLRGRPTGYLDHLRRLTPARIRRAFIRAGVTALRFLDESRARETAGALRLPLGLYYRLSGLSPFIEVVATRP